MKRAAGVVLLGLSACGYPLTQIVIRRWGMRGAAVVESMCIGLTVRDASMVASGAPARLRPSPAALLRLELAAGLAASLAGLNPLLNARPTDTAAPASACTADTVRQAAVAMLFTLHTIRFGIYLRPGQGRRTGAAAPASSPVAER
jgi:hypothetical protein